MSMSMRVQYQWINTWLGACYRAGIGTCVWIADCGEALFREGTLVFLLNFSIYKHVDHDMP